MRKNTWLFWVKMGIQFAMLRFNKQRLEKEERDRKEMTHSRYKKDFYKPQPKTPTKKVTPTRRPTATPKKAQAAKRSDKANLKPP